MFFHIWSKFREKPKKRFSKCQNGINFTVRMHNPEHKDLEIAYKKSDVDQKSLT